MFSISLSSETTSGSSSHCSVFCFKRKLKKNHSLLNLNGWVNIVILALFHPVVTLGQYDTIHPGFRGR